MRASIRQICKGIPVLLTAGFLAACSGNQKHTSTDLAGQQQPQDVLTGSTWVATRILGQAAGAAESLLIFVAEDRVGGSTGCNNFNGGVEIAGENIKFGLLAATRKMCDAAISGQEIVFLEALDATRQWQRTGDTLILSDAAAAVVMELALQKDAAAP
jgi:heat shock protein HslJ